MKVFISWSGIRSRIVAEALRSWLPSVLQALEPWLSSADISAGSRWHHDLAAGLSVSNFGIICLTAENQGSHWLLYEAGALSRSVDDARVVPYLIGLRKPEVTGPLSQFQAVESEKEGTFELLRSLNSALAAAGERALTDSGLSRAYGVWWPELEIHLQRALGEALSADDIPPSAMESRLLNNLLQVVSDYRVVLEKLHSSKRLEVRSRQ